MNSIITKKGVITKGAPGGKNKVKKFQLTSLIAIKLIAKKIIKDNVNVTST
jgi:hypothetical protein